MDAFDVCQAASLIRQNNRLTIYEFSTEAG